MGHVAAALPPSKMTIRAVVCLTRALARSRSSAPLSLPSPGRHDAEFHDYLSAFREGLQKLGWTEGRNIQIDSRWGALDDADARQRTIRKRINRVTA
jgi:hypothetical protein